MDNVSFQHHENIGKLNKYDTIENYPFTENCYNLKLSKDLVMS